jgi:hypothetical protein
MPYRIECKQFNGDTSYLWFKTNEKVALQMFVELVPKLNTVTSIFQINDSLRCGKSFSASNGGTMYRIEWTRDRRRITRRNHERRNQ